MDNKGPEWQEQAEARIREAFELFDEDKTEKIVVEEVGTVMRELGVFPSERALVLEILPDMQDDEPTGYVPYSKFLRKMLQLLATREWEPDSPDLILQAFRTIDTENKGYITAETMSELLLNKGTPFRPPELDAFLLTSKDPETGNVYYEDYVALIAKNNATK